MMGEEESQQDRAESQRCSAMSGHSSGFQVVGDLFPRSSSHVAEIQPGRNVSKGNWLSSDSSKEQDLFFGADFDCFFFI